MCSPGQAVHVPLAAEGGTGTPMTWDTSDMNHLCSCHSQDLDDTLEITSHLDLPSGRTLIIIIIQQCSDVVYVLECFLPPLCINSRVSLLFTCIYNKCLLQMFAFCVLVVYILTFLSAHVVLCCTCFI